MLEIDAEQRLGAFRLDIHMRAPSRGVIALFGRSGSGKTSLVNMLAGLTRPTRGRIVIDDTVLFDSTGTSVPPERRRLGYVFQEDRLFPHLSVRSNLLYGHRRAPARDRTTTIAEIVELLGIGYLLDRRPARLSGGEKQRIAIGRALLAHPRLLLMDEPLASLDAARKEEILPFIERLRDHLRLPIVYVTHGMAVDMPDGAEPTLGLRDHRAQFLMIGTMVAGDARLYLGDAEPSVVDSHGGADQAAHDAEAAGAAMTGHDRMGPGLAEQQRVDLLLVAVGIDIAAREQGRQQRSAMSRRRREQLIDEGILGAPHHLDRRGEIEVWRIDAAAVRGIEHDRHGIHATGRGILPNQDVRNNAPHRTFYFSEHVPNPLQPRGRSAILAASRPAGTSLQNEPGIPS